MGRLVSASQSTLPPMLCWKIHIPLNDFVLSEYPIFNSVIELGEFSLPHYFFHSNTQPPAVLKSWRDLPFKKHDFRDSWVDNIGFIIYHIKYKYLAPDDENGESSEFFDNIIDIYEIEFGERRGDRIHWQRGH